MTANNSTLELLRDVTATRLAHAAAVVDGVGQRLAETDPENAGALILAAEAVRQAVTEIDDAVD
jgi:hypothetical protein